MTKLVWGEYGERSYSNGVDKCVLYVGSLAGVPWNGISSIDETSAENLESFYMDGQRYLNVVRIDDYSAKLTAFGCPEEFYQCDGLTAIRNGLFVTNQNKKTFNLTYRTMVTNDKGTSYKIHLLYNISAKADNRAYKSVGSNVDVTTFSWNLFGVPPSALNYRPSAHVIVDTSITYPWVISALESILYGDDDNNARFPSQSELIDLFEESSILQVDDHGDGSFTISGPDNLIHQVDSTTYTVTTPSIVYIDRNRYTISSL